MVEQLGLEPGSRLQELERAILAHDPALDPPARASRPPPTSGGRSRAGGGWLIAAAGAILLAAIVGAAVKLSGSGSGSVRVRAAPNSVAVIDPHTTAWSRPRRWEPAPARSRSDLGRCGSQTSMIRRSRGSIRFLAHAAGRFRYPTPRWVWPRAVTPSGWCNPTLRQAACRSIGSIRSSTM